LACGVVIAVSLLSCLPQFWTPDRISVTHEIGFARKVADRVVFMERGEILEEGPSEALFAALRKERRVRFLSRVLGH
jgi:ABC-type polar amino acid transport system ATPase subunit